MAMYGDIWSYMAMYGDIWPYMAMYGDVVEANVDILHQVTTRGIGCASISNFHQRLYMVIYAHAY